MIRTVIVMTSKSSFLPEELERRISRGYCRGDRPSGICLYVYIGPIRGYEVVRGWANTVIGLRASE